MMGFLRELRERNVDRAALAYAGAGWLIAQGGQLLADAYQWPGWVIRALLAALMLGFPLVLVLAWFFEWTLAGLVADGTAAPVSSIRLRTRRKLDLARAIALDARNATPHYRLALLRGFSGRFDEALAEMQIARELEPLWAPAAANHAWLLVLAGRYAEAEAEARRAIEIDPDFAHSRSVLGRALLGQGRYDEALEAFRSRKGRGPGSFADVVVMLVSAGRLDEVRQELDGVLALSRQRYVSAYDIAVGHAALGDERSALDWLDRSVEQRGTMQSIGVEPALAALRTDPRFKAIVKRVGVPDTVWSVHEGG